MKKYLIKLVFYIQRNSLESEQEFEEQFWCISAESCNQALQKAQMIGEKEEGGVEAPNPSKLFWKFIDVSEVIELEDRTAPKLLFTTTAKTKCEENYIRFVQTKAGFLKSKNPTFV